VLRRGRIVPSPSSFQAVSSCATTAVLLCITAPSGGKVSLAVLGVHHVVRSQLTRRGVPMLRNKILFPLLLLPIISLVSCSGLPKSGGGGGGGGGSLPISLTLSTVPASVPTTVSLLSFTVTISGISLTSQTTGQAVNLTPTNPVVDLNRLLSDSAYLGKFSVPSDSFSKIAISITSSAVVFCPSSSGVAGCTAGAIKTVTGGPAILTFTYTPPLNPTTKGIGVRFRLFMARALILNSAGTAIQSIDFTQPLVGLSEQLPLAANLTAGQLDYVEDVTGVVTNVGASSITLKSATAGTITANVVAATSNFSIQNCPSNAISCAKVNQVANVDTIVNADGTFTLLLFDPLDAASNDWIEGVIGYAPTSGSQFQFVVTNFVPAGTGSVFGSNLHLGDQVTVNLASGTTFGIDQKNLTVPANSFAGSQSTSALSPGQVVAVRATAFTAASGATPASVTVNSLLLRFSRLSGNPGSPGPNFTFLPFAPYLGISVNSQTQETSGVTNYDLFVAGTALTANQAAGIRALYLGPPSTSIFVVAKVRQ
jgi:hypothetical protein